jgi:ribosomal protein S12 methylthiotransferase
METQHADQRAHPQKAKLGKRLPVIVDRGRRARREAAAPGIDAPEIDGAVQIESRRPLRVGDIVTVKIEAADAYDLRGVAV